ncbi:MAG TPA: hypothetical protein VHQ65_06450 [Thermoanaerobaculia bacterium]|nr:hypothetical protein [Thermoanaerobaculia bacterium]
MSDFDRYIGVRYSGRKGPAERVQRLKVFEAMGEEPPYAVANDQDEDGRWSRRELAEWLLGRLGDRESPTVVGLDHAFSFPRGYMEQHGLRSWKGFLDHFQTTFPTHEISVRELIPGNPRTHDPDEHRLTADWTASPRSLFNFDLQDSPAKSAFAGLPWLPYLRRAGEHVHVWPFDGWEVPPGAAVVAEVRPARLRHRYPQEGLAEEEHSAYAIAAWLQDRDRLGLLRPYFSPPLSPEERERAALEGWILGVA